MTRISRAVFTPPVRRDVMSNEPLKDLLDITFDANTKGGTFFASARADTTGIEQQKLEFQELGGIPVSRKVYEFFVRVPQFAGRDMSGRFDNNPLPYQGRFYAGGDVEDWIFELRWYDVASGTLKHTHTFQDSDGTLTGGPTQGAGFMFAQDSVGADNIDNLMRVEFWALLRSLPQTPKVRHFVAAIFWWEDSEEFTYPPLPDLSEPPTEYLTLGQYAGVVPAMWPQDPHERDDDALDLDQYDMTIQTP